MYVEWPNRQFHVVFITIDLFIGFQVDENSLIMSDKQQFCGWLHMCLQAFAIKTNNSINQTQFFIEGVESVVKNIVEIKIN